MITWRDVSAPSFGESNRLLESGSNKIASSIQGLGSMAQGAASTIKDKNTQGMIDSLSNLGSGLDGIEALEGLKTTSLAADSLKARFGSSINRERLDGSVESLKNDFVGQAFGEFNEKLALAKETGDFSQLSDFTNRADGLLDDASAMRNAAVDSENRYVANDLYQQWQSGGMSLGDFRKAAREMNNNPYMLEGLSQANAEMRRNAEEAKRRQETAMMGNLFIKGNTLLEKVKTGEMNSSDVLNTLTEGMSAEDVGSLIPVLSGVQRDAEQLELSRLQLRPEERLRADATLSVIEGVFDRALQNTRDEYDSQVNRLGVLATNIKATPEALDEAFAKGDEDRVAAVRSVLASVGTEHYENAVLLTYLQTGKNRLNIVGGNRAVKEELDDLQRRFQTVANQYNILTQTLQDTEREIQLRRIAFNEANVDGQLEMIARNPSLGRQITSEAENVASGYNRTVVGGIFPEVQNRRNPDAEEAAQLRQQVSELQSNNRTDAQRASFPDPRASAGGVSSVMSEAAIERNIRARERRDVERERRDVAEAAIEDIVSRAGLGRSDLTRFERRMLRDTLIENPDLSEIIPSLDESTLQELANKYLVSRVNMGGRVQREGNMAKFEEEVRAIIEGSN